MQLVFKINRAKCDLIRERERKKKNKNEKILASLLETDLSTQIEKFYFIFSNYYNIFNCTKK